jgi:hypothetical protein
MTCSVTSSVPKFPETAVSASSSGSKPKEGGRLPTITTHYGIKGPVPFVDVEVTVTTVSTSTLMRSAAEDTPAVRQSGAGVRRHVHPPGD